jgi:hypothetical protein
VYDRIHRSITFAFEVVDNDEDEEMMVRGE